MAWIQTISYKKANNSLRRIYDRISGPDHYIDNVLSIHSLRPHTLSGHMALYKSVLHNTNNSLPKWYLEAIGVYVSVLNKCQYCVAHHSEGLNRIIRDAGKCKALLNALIKDRPASFFESKYLDGMIYAKLLTLSAYTITAQHIESLKTNGFTEGEILEINQVCSYFNYVNRTVLGLGVSLKGDKLGLSHGDSSDPGNWHHQ